MSSRSRRGVCHTNQGPGSRGQRVDAMARKREERAVRQAYRKEKKAASYLAEDGNFQSFTQQLAKLGLQLRDIPGDGNCLFRALGDQLEGHGRNHMKHRLDTVQYMVDNRSDFEPFVEDDVPFEKYVSNLKQPGTYAGNDAIVSFARLHKLKVVIHQLGSPCWQISGSDKPGVRELHISYHNGDHYSSVRGLGDNTESPANILIKGNKKADPKLEKKVGSPSEAQANYCDKDYPGIVGINNNEMEGMARAVRDWTDVEEDIMANTGCHDRLFVRQALEFHFYNIDDTTDYIIREMVERNQSLGYGSVNGSEDALSVSSTRTCDSGIWSENGTGSRLFGPAPSHTTHSQGHPGPQSSNSKTKNSHRPNVSTREKNKLKKLEKKKRAEERHRQKVRGIEPQIELSSEEEETTTVVTKEMGMLNI